MNHSYLIVVKARWQHPS